MTRRKCPNSRLLSPVSRVLSPVSVVGRRFCSEASMMQTTWPRCFFWSALLLVIAAESATAMISAQLGLLLHGLLIVGLAAYRALARSRAEQTFALALLMAPLTRVLSLALPLDRFPQIAWYAIA